MRDKEDMIAYWEDHIRELVHEQAEKLRRIAADLDREADAGRDIHALVQSAIHAVAWGVANLNQDSLVGWLQQIAALRAEPDETPKEN